MECLAILHLNQSLIISRISYTRDSKHKINIEQICSPSHEVSISLSTQLFTISQQLKFKKDESSDYKNMAKEQRQGHQFIKWS